MKRFLFLFVIAVALFVSAYAAKMTAFRPDVNASGSAYTYNLVCDSSDTFQVDTFFSDTLPLGEYKYLAYNLQLAGYTLADSANDSLLVIVKGYAMYDGKFKTTIITDTIPTTLGTLDSTAVISGTYKYDSTGFNEMYFETVVKDSFIMGAGIDTSVLRLDYRILESEVVDK